MDEKSAGAVAHTVTVGTASLAPDNGAFEHIVRGLKETPKSASERFETRSVLGEGGMGRVLDVRDQYLRRDVAVKVLKGTASERRRQRFLAEAQVTAQLEHPNIVPAYDAGEFADGTAYIVLRKVTGKLLTDVLATDGHGAETHFEWLRIFVALARTVAFAHARGVLHRDIKPDNVMIGSFGEVLLLDWGVAKLMGQEDLPFDGLASGDGTSGSVERLRMDATAYGSIMGTLGYASPEQTLGDLDRLDQRSDVWSLGSVLFEMLTGTRAWTDRTPAGLHRFASGELWPDPRDHVEDLPAPWSRSVAALWRRTRPSAPPPPRRWPTR